jgi:type II secretory pathway pseudopilin PulG
MQLRLRTKLTLVMTGLVVLVVAVLSGVFVGQLLEQVLQETDKRAHEIAQQVFQQAQRALTDAAEQGLRPASNEPQDIHDYVRRAFEINESLRAQLKAAKDTPSIYEVSIADHNGMALVSTDESLPGKFLPRHAPLSQLTQRGYVQQVKVLAGPPRVYEFD